MKKSTKTLMFYREKPTFRKLEKIAVKTVQK